MRRIGELMREIGFNPEAPDSTQRAFFRHLSRAAENISPENHSESSELKPREAQLSFDPEILGTVVVEPKKKTALNGR